MSLTSMLKQSATIRRQGNTGPRDDYNAPTVQTSTTQVMTFIEPLSIEEDTVLRDTGRISVKAFFEPSVTIDMTDLVVVGDTTYEVIGPPQEMVRAPSGMTHHLEVYLTAVS